MLLKGMEFDTTHFITDVSGKYPRLWALKGAHPLIVNRWYKFGVLASIHTIAPGTSVCNPWLACATWQRVAHSDYGLHMLTTGCTCLYLRVIKKNVCT
ncbi:hypothetical protein ACS0TY_010538 [Phlomoides rotata]